jgi:acetyl-CoA C-acetyltransferase
VTTAGNASGVNDGAVALVVRLASLPGEKAGAKPIARIIASAAMGVPPRHHGHRPGRRLAKRRWPAPASAVKDMDIIEINEAFAAQVLACLKGLGVAFDDARVNPNGGAIAVGHPLGASGARIALTAPGSCNAAAANTRW